MKKISLLVVVALLVGVPGITPLDVGAQVATGIVEGRVRLEPPPPPRRSVDRYPGSRTEVHQIQVLPAVAYLVGPVQGSQARSGSNAAMVQRDTTFVPSVVTTPVGGTVVFPNDDPFFHNVFSYSSTQRFDLGRYPQGESKSVTFPEPGIVEVFCEVHEFMRGAIIVTANAYTAVVSDDGSFRIPDVPEGEHTIAIWHPDHQQHTQVIAVTSGGTTRVEVELSR